MMQHDIEAYRSALGYSIPGNHNGRLSDGTVPQCGMCNSEHRKNLESDYNELLFAVEKKFPNETRHQTAVRYIREAEKFMESMPTQSKPNL